MTKPESAETDVPDTSSEHRGSASTNLTGRAVVAAWVVSIAVHGLLFLGMLVLVFPFGGREDSPTDFTATHAEIVGSLDGMSLMPTPVPDRQRVTMPDSKVARFTPKVFTPLSEMTMTKKPELSIIGIGAGGGDFARHGLMVGGMPGPEFFGVGGSARGARKIVYVVDMSGSMIDTFEYVRGELKRSISALRRSQKFHVIFFNATQPLENTPKRLVSAIDAQKEQFFEFLKDVVPRGGTQPGPALRRALALEPDLIYLLTDGDRFSQDLPRKLDAWNRDHHTRIYTIGYLNELGRAMLEQIAREHQGEFKFVSEYDLP